MGVEHGMLHTHLRGCHAPNMHSPKNSMGEKDHKVVNGRVLDSRYLHLHEVKVLIVGNDLPSSACRGHILSFSLAKPNILKTKDVAKALQSKP